MYVVSYVKDFVKYKLLVPWHHVMNGRYFTADGKPLEVGMTVKEASTGTKYVVVDLYRTCVEEDFPCHTVKCVRLGEADFKSHMFQPDMLCSRRYRKKFVL